MPPLRDDGRPPPACAATGLGSVLVFVFLASLGTGVFWNAIGFIAKHGSVYPTKDKDGNPAGFRAFPQVKIASDLMSHLGRLEQKFGMSPADRASVEVMDDGGSVDFDDEKFLNIG